MVLKLKFWHTINSLVNSRRDLQNRSVMSLMVAHNSSCCIRIFLHADTTNFVSNMILLLDKNLALWVVFVSFDHFHQLCGWRGVTQWYRIVLWLMKFQSFVLNNSQIELEYSILCTSLLLSVWKWNVESASEFSSLSTAVKKHPRLPFLTCWLLLWSDLLPR